MSFQNSVAVLIAVVGLSLGILNLVSFNSFKSKMYYVQETNKNGFKQILDRLESGEKTGGGIGKVGAGLSSNSPLSDQVVRLVSEIESASRSNIRFRSVSPTQVQLSLGASKFARLVLFGNGEQIPLTLNHELVADITKLGPGGVSVPALAPKTGLEVYVIAKSGGQDPQLYLHPADQKLSLPAGYQLSSEILWFVSVDNKQINPFTDVGDGTNLYEIRNNPTPFARLTSDDPELSVWKLVWSEVPKNASWLYYKAIGSFSSRKKPKTRFGIWYGQKGDKLAGYMNAIPAVKRDHRINLTGGIPIVDLWPTGDLILRYSEADYLEEDNKGDPLESGGGRSGKGGAVPGAKARSKAQDKSGDVKPRPSRLRFYIVGWKLSRRYE